MGYYKCSNIVRVCVCLCVYFVCGMMHTCGVHRAKFYWCRRFLSIVHFRSALDFQSIMFWMEVVDTWFQMAVLLHAPDAVLNRSCHWNAIKKHPGTLLSTSNALSVTISFLTYSTAQLLSDSSAQVMTALSYIYWSNLHGTYIMKQSVWR